MLPLLVIVVLVALVAFVLVMQGRVSNAGEIRRARDAISPPRRP
jgi:hypothetical protein